MIGNLINNKINRQILSLLLTMALLAGLFPTAAFAQSSLPSIGVDGEIIAFEPLDDSISNQTVAFGTSLEDLALPDTLIATAEIIQPGAPEDTIEDSGKMMQEDEVKSEDEGGNLQLKSSEDTNIGGVSQMTVLVPVKWEAEPIYDGNAPGEYLFTALVEDMLLAEDMQFPQISVEVLAEIEIEEELEEEITGGLITAFTSIEEDIRFQRGETPILLKELNATVGGETFGVPVTWESETNADENGLHVFEATPDAAYSLGDGVPKPILSFYRTPMMQMRMMGGGNENSPLEITTEYQLAEIAALTNAGKLEEMVFGKGATKQVHIRLMNDLDIEGIDPKGDKSGWVPIGTWDDRFKGQFDGGGNIIKGLTIDRSSNFQGLFGDIDTGGTVSGIGIVDVSIKGNNAVGGLVGRIEFLSTVENCYVTGSVSGAQYIGGVVGNVSHGTLTNCYTTCFVKGTKYIGGVAGDDSSGSTSNCAALNPSIIGGEVDVGRVVGYAAGPNNYAFSGMTINGNTVIDGAIKDGIGKSAAEITADATIFGLFTGDNGWTTENGFLPGLGGRTVEMPAHLLDNASPFSGGDGNSAETAYEITTPDQLAKLAELVNSGNDFAGKYFQLMNDLDLGDIDPKGDKTGWIPIGTWIPGALGGTDKPFSGVFDGKGHIVKNLTINRPSLNRVGLFGLVMGTNATIKNLGVVNATISGGGWTGGLVGINQGIVENCFVTGSIKGGETVGGVVGDVSTSGGIVRNCYSTALVIGTGGGYGGIGGVAGYAYSATIENCAALNPSVSGSVNVRRLVGQAGDINLTNNIAFSGMMVDGNTVDNSDTNGTGKTAAEISADGTIFGLFTAGNGWTTENDFLPGLGGKTVEMPLHLLSDANPFSGGDGSNAENAYQITTADQLAKLAELVNKDADDTKNGGKYADKYYGLMNDLDLRGFDPKGDNSGWVPIGTNDGSDKPFSGTFDGKGHVVKNLTINNSSLDRAGLFGLVMGTNATVKNIGVENVDISGGSWAGGLIGVNKGTLENSYVTGSIKGNKYVGGVVGDVSSSNGLVNNCYSSSNVKGADNVGGVAGYLGTGSTVTNCYSTGSVSATGSYGSAGGVVGYAATSSTVTNCYSTGSVNATGSNGSAGGVVGTVNRTVKNCAALNPSVTTIGSVVGRVVGQKFGGTLSHNYAFDGMTGGGDNKTHDGSDGADMTASDAINPAFWITDLNWETAGWDTAIWDIQIGKLPILHNVGGQQSGEPGLYLTPKSAENLIVTINGSYGYTGSLVTPDITVNFGDDTLVEDQDYTWAITSVDGDGTSAGIELGTVTITVTGIGGYSDEKTATFTIVKADQARPAAPTLGSKTTTSVMLNPVTGAEYRVDNGPWQSSNIFTELSPNTTYSLTIRLMGDANHEPSQASTELTVATDKAELAGIPVIDITSPQNGDLLKVRTEDLYSVPSISDLGALSYQWNRDSMPISGATGNTYIVVEDDIGKTITVTVTAVNCSGSITSAATAEVSIAPSFSISLDVGGTHSFPSGIVGYGSQTEKVITITNTGNQPTGALTISLSGDATAFVPSKTDITDIAVNKADSFTVTPVTGLPAGSYMATVTVEGNNGLAASFNVSFIVSSSGGGSHSGNNDSDDSYTTVTIIPTKQPDQPTIGSVIGKVKGTKTRATFTVTDSIIKAALQKAEAEANIQSRSVYGVGAKIILNTSTATTLTITLERAALNRLVSSGAKGFELTGTPISMIYDRQALSELQRQGAGNVTITVKLVTVKGVRNAYDITIGYLKDGKMVSITNLGKGSVTISIPYVLDKNEAAGYLYAVYVDDMRKINRIDDSSYDANSGSVLFNTNHFSVYGVGYEVPSAKFTDITNHWGKDSIDYVVGRGLLAGTSKTTFAPDTAMTRGMLVTALGRLAGVDVKVYTGSSFTDVKVDSTFRPYIEWAYKKGVVQGIGNEQFAPDRAVSREEIAVIFANFAKATGYKLPVTRTATAYADASSISNAYKTAVTAMQQAGIMMGGTGNKFNPKASATRAEVSSMLHRYIKLTIDPATAQGWALNDAGQYLYYKDGKTLNGWQAIDGVKYYFNAGGTLKTSWVKDGNNWRFYCGNKALVGWWNIGSDSAKKTYYFTKDGLMISDKWLHIDGKWYYFYADGSLAKSTEIDGYEVDGNGMRKIK